MIVVEGCPVLVVGPSNPMAGAVVTFVEIDTAGYVAADDVAAGVAAAGEVLWLAGTDAAQLVTVAERVEDIGVSRTHMVLEPNPGQLQQIVEGGYPTSCAPDRFGCEPGGQLEAAVTASVISGASLVRTRHTRVARRCIDVAETLLAERAGLAERVGDR